MRTKWVMGLLIAALVSIGHDRMSRQASQKAVLVSSAPPPGLTLAPIKVDLAMNGGAPMETLRCRLNSFSPQTPANPPDRLRFAF